MPLRPKAAAAPYGSNALAGAMLQHHSAWSAAHASNVHSAVSFLSSAIGLEENQQGVHDAKDEDLSEWSSSRIYPNGPLHVYRLTLRETDTPIPSFPLPLSFSSSFTCSRIKHRPNTLPTPTCLADTKVSRRWTAGDNPWRALPWIGVDGSAITANTFDDARRLKDFSGDPRNCYSQSNPTTLSHYNLPPTDNLLVDPS